MTEHNLASGSATGRTNKDIRASRWRQAAQVALGLLAMTACGHSDPAGPGGSSPGAAHLDTLTIDPGDNTLSNEPFVAVSNGWGPVERNRSNGETGAADGHPLTVDGVVYARGFGVHAASSMTFAVQGMCRTLTATIGIDDEVGSRGSVVFQVYGDGVKLYDSGLLTGASAARPLTVDISGRSELRLVVTDGGDGNAYDHADWAGTMLRSCTSAPGPVPVASGAALRLNTGGPAQTVDGTPWVACTAVTACSGYVTGGAASTPVPAPTITGVTPPANPTIYQSAWIAADTQALPAGSSAFKIRVPVANGRYQIRLHFAEWIKTAAGQRVFDVRLENSVVLDHFDVFREAGGAGRAVVRSFDVTVQDGAVDLDFLREVDTASLNALELQPLGLGWTNRAAAPSTLYEAQGAAVNGKLYVFGGFYTNLNGTKPAATRKAWVYDASADRWAPLRDIPDAVTHAGVAVNGTDIYLAGGFLGNHPGPQTDHVWRYDTLTDTWTALPPLPGARGAGALVLLGRDLHYFGGTERTSGGSYLRDDGDHWTLSLDAPTTWRSLAPLPVPRNHLGGVALGGLIYAVGGQHLGDEAHGDLTDVHAYDPATNTWRAVAPLPLPLGHITSSTVAWQQRVVVAGGVTLAKTSGAIEGAESDTMLSYDPVTNRWSTRTALPAVRQSPVADVIADRLVVTTGSNSAGPTNTTWQGQ
ncbi:hypothetical protein E7T09_16525 [Deinococcus sp. KSM4-11]|uniref:NPCBM/NEW2 domain-containing protein n=1 Tax=Deinococcus sp. KSM4-11 TaxID=2568654 RepID=UPI0010A4306A|nr:NPCBM/NEW2 domain-containing protein [Deinococcus sp. KSM4-11]THF85556.1 hypothetical protein E7T09_16525 [Deinococcus sp. KSM4-11]